MKKLLLVLLLAGCASLPQHKLVGTYTTGEGTATFYDEPCTNPAVLSFVPEEFKPYMRAGTATYEGKEYATCWIPRADGRVILFQWEDGGLGGAPLQDIKFAADV